MNMKCPFCNNEIEDDAKFCTSCGKEIIAEIKCPKCQTSNSVSSKFCKSCGASLKEKEEEKKSASKQERKPIDKTKLGFIFSIVSSSLLLVSMVLMMFTPLIPVFYDNFFPINNFTMVSVASNLADYIRTKQYVGIANSSIAILLSVAILVVALIFIGLSIPEFVKAIKGKTFVDLSKKTTILYILVLGSFIYLANFALFQDGEIVTTFNGGLIFIVVLIAFTLCFNLFVKEFLSEKHELLPLIVRGVGRLLVIVFSLIVVFNIGQTRFTITGLVSEDGKVITSHPVNLVGGNISLYSFFIENSKYIYDDGVSFVISSLIFTSISMLLEVIILLLTLQLISKPLFQDINKGINHIPSIILTGLSFLLSITTLVFNILCNKALNNLNSLEAYSIEITSTLNNNKPIIYTIFLGLLLIISIGFLVVEKVAVKGGKEHE